MIILYIKRDEFTMTVKDAIKKMKLILFLPLGVIISYMASKSPAIVENFYSNGFYTWIAQGISRITGIFPFSAGEILFILLIIFFIYRLIFIALTIIKEPSRGKYIFLNFILNTTIFISIIYFAFIMLWGLNYHRFTFSKLSDLNIKPASINELAFLCDNLIQRGNKLREKVEENSLGVMKLSYSHSEFFKRASKGYEEISNTYPELKGQYGIPKGIFLSKALSISGISGIYSPLTFEANVNTEIPDSMLPSTTCHEIAHQRGFAREDEANFISYLACIQHPDVEFQYSGTLLALIHAMNALNRHDKGRFIDLHGKYSEGVLRDLKFIRKFWKSYEGPIERASSKLNNAYLKSNYQKDGIYSYGRMVDLLIAEYREKMVKGK